MLQDRALELLQRRGRAQARAPRATARSSADRPPARQPAGRRDRARASTAHAAAPAAGWRRSATRAPPISSPSLPSARSASIRSSSAASRASCSRPIAACANGSYAKSASGSPRHSPSAEHSRSLARAASPLGKRPPPLSAKRLEPTDVDLLGLDREPVAPPLRSRSRQRPAPCAGERRTPARSWPRSPAARSPHSSSTNRSVETTSPR